MYQPYGTNDFEYGRGGVDLSAFLGRTYRWMFLGLLTTFVVAFAGYWTGAVLLLFRSTFLLIGLTILQLVLVWRVSGSLHRISASSALGSFFAYAVLNGVLFSAYFLIFHLSSMIYAFAAAALYFGIMAFYGSRATKDLSGWGPILFAGLIALMVVGLIGSLFGMMGITEILYCGIGLVIFMGLTAYDVQRLGRMAAQVQPGTEMAEKISIYGALQLYLDFINIFLFILRMLSRSQDN